VIWRHARRLRRRVASGMGLRFPGMATRLPRALPLAVREDQCVREARELGLPARSLRCRLQAVRETGRAVDILLVDAHLGYYAARTVLERLRHDVIGPARTRYESIRLIGVSMGGLGALLYAARYPGHVTDVALLAPFVGEARVPSDRARLRAAGQDRAGAGPRRRRPARRPRVHVVRRSRLAHLEAVVACHAADAAARLSLPFSPSGCSWRDRGRLAGRYPAPRTPMPDRVKWRFSDPTRPGPRSTAVGSPAPTTATTPRGLAPPHPVTAPRPGAALSR
jgi:pimeloyl-ACP methyl ester carboxylesterase